MLQTVKKKQQQKKNKDNYEKTCYLSLQLTFLTNFHTIKAKNVLTTETTFFDPTT